MHKLNLGITMMESLHIFPVIQTNYIKKQQNLFVLLAIDFKYWKNFLSTYR